jgi:hypothetical protein
MIDNVPDRAQLRCTDAPHVKYGDVVAVAHDGDKLDTTRTNEIHIVVCTEPTIGVWFTCKQSGNPPEEALLVVTSTNRCDILFSQRTGPLCFVSAVESVCWV